MGRGVWRCLVERRVLCVSGVYVGGGLAGKNSVSCNGGQLYMVCMICRLFRFGLSVCVYFVGMCFSFLSFGESKSCNEGRRNFVSPLVFVVFFLSGLFSFFVCWVCGFESEGFRIALFRFGMSLSPASPWSAIAGPRL